MDQVMFWSRRGRTNLIESEANGEPCTNSHTEKEARCEVCGGRTIKDFERGQYVCRECGIVLDYPMLSSECEAHFSEGKNTCRDLISCFYDSGPPTTITIHDLGISSEIGGGFRDAKGRALNGKARYRAILLRRWHSRTRARNSKELTTAKALTALNDLADRLDLPKYVREEACAIYRKVVEKRLMLGRSVSVFVAVSLYAAIRRARLPLMLRDVLPILRIDLSEFNSYLNIMKSIGGVRVPAPDPVAWIPKIAVKCGFSQKSQLLAVEYIRAMTRMGETFGMLPHVVAAIALFRIGVANGERKNVYEVAKAAMCAPTSIQKGFVSESDTLRNLRSRKTAKPSPDMEGRKDPGIHLPEDDVLKEAKDRYSNLCHTSPQGNKVGV